MSTATEITQFQSISRQLYNQKNTFNSQDYFTFDKDFECERKDLYETVVTDYKQNLNISLRNKFKKELEINSIFFKEIDNEQLSYWVYAVIQKIVDCNARNVSIEVTSNKQILFTAICPNFNLYLDLFCENEINEFVEVVINAYKEKKCVFTVGGSFGNSIKALSQFNSQKQYALVQ
jgi:hypothetical protein